MMILLVGLITEMRAAMLGEVIALRECARAQRTAVRLFAGVDAVMTLQMVPASKPAKYKTIHMGFHHRPS